jgi:hypothetical protein
MKKDKAKKKYKLPRSCPYVLTFMSKQEVWQSMSEIDKDKRTEMWNEIGEYIICRGRNILKKINLCDKFFFGTYKLSDEILANLCERNKDRYGSLVIIKNPTDYDKFMRKIEGRNVKSIFNPQDPDKLAIIYDDSNENIVLALFEF